ncbi:MAG TPA: phosphoenolpyruvate carboxykinase (ATP), partial [Desulfobulbus sp.]|nr:phosphoenolpyruvate carboxykinase (ATP) [Desulfobulbus sp.]
LAAHDVDVWLINTGWSGGPYGTGRRISIAHTRAMVNAALDGLLAEVSLEREPFFGLRVPRHCPGVPDEVLDPRSTWDDPAAYDRQAARLAAMFSENFRQFADQTSPEVRAVDPGQLG